MLHLTNIFFSFDLNLLHALDETIFYQKVATVFLFLHQNIYRIRPNYCTLRVSLSKNTGKMVKYIYLPILRVHLKKISEGLINDAYAMFLCFFFFYSGFFYKTTMYMLWVLIELH